MSQSASRKRSSSSVSATSLSLETDNEEEHKLSQLERKFTKLAHKYSRSMLLCGLFQDVTLLFTDDMTNSGCVPSKPEEDRCSAMSSSSVSVVGLEKSGARSGEGKARGGKTLLAKLAKCLAFFLVLLANLIAFYVLVAHFIWEFRMLDAKNSNTMSMSAHQGNPIGGSNNPNNMETSAASSSSKGWSVLKEFLENLRRHILRLFAFALTLTWHSSYHQIELLFIDCRRYHAYFYRSSSRDERDEPASSISPLSAAAAPMSFIKADSKEAHFNDERLNFGQQQQHLQLKLHEIDARQRGRRQLLEAMGGFYRLASRRILVAIWLPVLHFLFNLAAISSFPSSDKRRPGRWLPSAGSGLQAAPLGLAANKTLAERWWLPGNLLAQASDNFDSFHLAVHTAFHPHDHHIRRAHQHQQQQLNNSSYTGNLQQPASLNGSNQFNEHYIQSAAFCLLELLIYSLYFNGPQVFCATCLSLVLNIHYQCISSFNKQLVAFIRRAKEKPLSSGDIVNLVKQYDLIGMMHEQIERTFKWSIVIWFSLMFISCLMHIFSFTESTSAYVVSHQQQRQLISAGANSTTTFQLNTGSGAANPSRSNQTYLAIQLIRIASLFFVCYSPYLIYSEAFKIESASQEMEQNVMRLARRKDDPLAQSIEPSLFEPIYLSVGDYFHLSRKSMSAFLGAIVTFSVMFIGELLLEPVMVFIFITTTWRSHHSQMGLPFNLLI